MKLLFLAPYYPYPNYLSLGSFNERSARVLSELCDTVEVLVPRPYAPPLLSSLSPRWKFYRHIDRHELRNGISVHRPCYLQIPRLGGAFWIDPGVFFWCRRAARKMHKRVGFDAIISFDLIGVGGLAWRLGRYLGIPASGWAIGGDLRFPGNSYKRVLLEAIRNLDIVFYQSQELLEKSAELLGLSAGRMPKHGHVVLPRGIPSPPLLARTNVRNQMRGELGIRADQIVVLNVGRIVRDKGIFELLEAISLAGSKDPRIICVCVGSIRGLDETNEVQKKLDQSPHLKTRVRLLPSCSPDKVWEYLCGADIFAFPSHEEGMPNSLLEAMVMGIPSIAFEIPPVLEIEAGARSLLAVPLKDSRLLSEAILRLSGSADEKARIGERGKVQVEKRFLARQCMAEAIRRLAELVANPHASRSRTRGSRHVEQELGVRASSTRLD